MSCVGIQGDSINEIEGVIIAVVFAIKAIAIKPEKCFRGFNRNRTHGLCVSAAVLHSGAAVLYLLNWPAPGIWVFIAQLVEHCSANAEAMGSNPVEAPKTFFGLNSDCLNPKHNCVNNTFISFVCPQFT